MPAVCTFFVFIIQLFCYGFADFHFVEQETNCVLDFGRTGSCVHIKKCPQAIEQIRKRQRPHICGFEGIYPHVCCENDFFRASWRREFVASRKCKEYAITSNPITTTTASTLSMPPFLDTAAIGGEDAFPLEFPHMAILGYGSFADVKWRCGGSLISEKFVLTAAHCIFTRFGQVQYVKLGVHELNLTSQHEQTFNVNRVYRHPDYVRSQDYHDIGLVELDRQADIQSGVKPACLHTLKELPDYSLVATGWGAVELHGDIYNTLQKVYLSHVSTDICRSYYDGQIRLSNGVIDNWQICADGGGKVADTCQGDSGGPLQIKFDHDILYTIVGITSLGIKCAVVPGVYTRVSYYVPWIESVVWPNE